MSQMAQDNIKIFISAAEVSGDHHAARLMRQFTKDGKQIEWHGLGGEAMEAAGCTLLDNPVSRSAMLAHAFGQIGYYWNLLAKVKKHLAETRPQLVITVDSPAWNIHIIKAAKKLGIPTMQYVAPQLWAWAPWRASKWRNNADKIACVLPFEPDWFAAKNISAEFVGHPLFDDRPEFVPAASQENDNEEESKQLTVALLPGSRKAEIEELWRPMLEIAKNLSKKFDSITFLTAAANDKIASQLTQDIPDEISLELCKEGLIEATARADLAIIASGTATLETAVAGCPMIVLYHVPGWQWHLVGKHILTVNHISLVNILANKQLVPEFVPFASRTKEVTETATALLNNPAKLEVIRKELKKLTRPLAENTASENTARLAYDLIGI